MSDGTWMSDDTGGHNHGWQGGIAGPNPIGTNIGGPSVVYTGFPGVFAYVSMAQSTQIASGGDGPDWANDTPLDIVVATSVDGGVTFGPAAGRGGMIFRISDPQSSAIDTAGGKVFMPTITMESPGVPTLGTAVGTHVAWVTWDNTNVPFNGGGKRPWIRKIIFRADGSVDLSSPVTEVRIDCGYSCTKFDSQNIAAKCEDMSTVPNSVSTTCTGCIANGVGCIPGHTYQDEVLMAFPRVNNSPFGTTALTDNQHNSGATCSTMFDVEWHAAISVDGGSTWTQGIGNSDGSSIMGEEQNWKNCIVGMPPAGASLNGNNRGRMAVLHDDGGDSWHVFWTKEVAETGGATGQRIWHSVLDDPFTGVGTPSSNEELAPLTAGGCTPECLGDQFMPSAAWSVASPQNIVAVSWLDTQRNPTTPQGAAWGAFSKNDGSLGTFMPSPPSPPPGGANLEIDQAGTASPWSFTGSNGDTPWGDYNGMASDGAGTFFPAYGDNRCGMTSPPSCPPNQTHVWARAWMP